MIGRPRKLTPEQHRIIADRSALYMRLRLEAAKHSPDTLARELNVCTKTVRAYFDRPLRNCANG